MIHGYPLCSLFAFLHSETALLEAKGRIYFRHEKRKLPCALSIAPILAPIEKHILIPGVSMHIDNHLDFVGFVQTKEHLFRMINLRMQSRRCLSPFPIQVVAGIGKTVVAQDDAIGIYHGDYFEDIFIA